MTDSDEYVFVPTGGLDLSRSLAVDRRATVKLSLVVERVEPVDAGARVTLRAVDGPYPWRGARVDVTLARGHLPPAVGDLGSIEFNPNDCVFHHARGGGAV